MEHSVQTLLDELKHTKKNGTKEEQDHVYLKLKDKASEIEHEHAMNGVSNSLQQFYTAITHKTLPTAQPASSIQEISESRPTPKLVLFVRKLSQLGDQATPDDHIADWDSIPQRGKKLKQHSNDLCKDCKHNVLPELFIRTARMGVKELKKEEMRLKKMKNNGLLTDYRYTLVIQELETVIDSMTNLVMDHMKRFEKGQKVDWISGVESIVLLWVRLYNHCLNQYVTAAQDQKSLQY